MCTLIEATTDDDFDAVRTLCWAYRDVLLGLGGIDSEAVLHYYPVPTYRQLMLDLPELHARPKGSVKLVLLDDVPVGCGMVYEFAPGVAEIKRVYVDPSAQGQGIGQALMEALIAQARSDGYASILMDTGRKLEAACRLYDRLGFERRGPYQDVPEDLRAVMVFFEMRL